MKIFAYGIYENSNSYFRDVWNFIDFFSLIINIFSLFLSTGSVTAFRALRSIRVLKLSKYNKGLHITVIALSKAAPMII